MTNTPIAFWAISCFEASIFVLNLKMGGWGQENMFFWCEPFLEETKKDSKRLEKLKQIIMVLNTKRLLKLI